jgi:transcriptional regulator with XRE-family HTH domain
MADLGGVRDVLPLPSAGHQNSPHFNVERFVHSAILVKDCSTVKEHFTKRLRQAYCMPEKESINRVVAKNLAYWMQQAGNIRQTALAEKAGVSQKTISNYLNPDQRAEGGTGREPSAKLAELEKIAKALHVEVWQLLRSMSPSERAMYEAIEKAYADLRTSMLDHDQTQAQTQSPTDERVNVRYRVRADSAPGKGLVAVKSATKPAIKTPAMDREDASLGRDLIDERNRNRPASKPKGPRGTKGTR